MQELFYSDHLLLFVLLLLFIFCGLILVGATCLLNFSLCCVVDFFTKIKKNSVNTLVKIPERKESVTRIDKQNLGWDTKSKNATKPSPDKKIN